MLIHRISLCMANRLANTIGWDDKIAEITYGFELIIGEALKFSLLLVLALSLGIANDTILVLSTALPYRLSAGGPHSKTYFKCTLVTLISYLFLGLAAQNFISKWSNHYLIIFIASITITGCVVIKFWVPGENPNRRIETVIEKQKFQLFSKIILVVWVTLSTMVYIFFPLSAGKLIVPTGFGLAWQNLIVTPLGYFLLNTVDSIGLRR